MNRFVFLLLVLAACKTRNKTEPSKETFFPVLSYLQSQVKKVDTSLYSIKMIEQKDSLPPDTVYLRREQFRQAASDFLNIPDIASDKWRNDYTESQRYDDLMQSSILTYTCHQPANSIQQVDVMLNTDDPVQTKVQTIIIRQSSANKDSAVEKNMVWEVDRSFVVVTKVQKPNGIENIYQRHVSWNDFHTQ